MVADDLLDRAWQIYRSQKAPADAPDEALLILREAFFMGAATAFYTLVALGETDGRGRAAVDRQTADRILDSLHRELDAFGFPPPVRYVFLRGRES